MLSLLYKEQRKTLHFVTLNFRVSQYRFHVSPKYVYLDEIISVLSVILHHVYTPHLFGLKITLLALNARKRLTWNGQ